MAEREESGNFLGDIFNALKLVSRLTWRQNIEAWIYVPIGILIILLACFGVNSIIRLSGIQFPASVACLVILFFSLLLSDYALGERKTRAIVKIMDIPAGWSLRYISLFFTPSFVLLPLSPPIGGVEVAKIITVFLIGYVVVFVLTAYITRGLQKLLGTSKRALTERAEEMGAEDDNIPLADATRSRQESQVTLGSIQSEIPTPSRIDDHNLSMPLRTQDPDLIRGTGGPPEAVIPPMPPSQSVAQSPLPFTRPQRWATLINQNFDRLTWLLILLISLPIYYTIGYAMPTQLSLNVLAYFAALALPAQYRQFLHPVLVSSAVTIMGIWAFGALRGDILRTILLAYRSRTRYLDLWYGAHHLPLPGAGDIFSSVLDASIVALAIPMYSYRFELRRHFLAIVIPNISISIASLFGYPVLCYAIGVSTERSLAFAARSLTLALATPAVVNLGGDVNTGAALAIMSGISGVLVGNRILKWLKIPEDDYVTRGVTMGANSSAIATALLLVSDPRAAALSSLSMSLFGIITLALTSVPPVVRAVQELVGL